MSAVIPDQGKIQFAIKSRDASASEGWKIKLFQNDYTPDHTTTLAALTEATFTGYAPVVLSGGTVAPSVDAGGRAVLTWNQVSWTKNGGVGNQIYGYWVIDGPGALLFAERASTAPVRMASDGDSLLITPQLTDKSEFSNT